MTTIKFKSLSSGSCGNCYFIGLWEDKTLRASILIDAGVSLRRAKQELARDGIAVETIDAMLVTHDHMDHVRSLGSYCKRLKKPVWASEILHNALNRSSMIHPWISDCRRVLKQDETWIVPDLISVRHFILPHDATQTIGYSLNLDGYRFVIATDTGRVTDELLAASAAADTVVLESNYDVEMLKNGPYPKLLQDRIRDGHGHLSNDECAAAIGEFNHPGLENIFLCHLSDHNNTPELAVSTSRVVLDANPECKPRLTALPRQVPSVMFILRH